MPATLPDNLNVHVGAFAESYADNLNPACIVKYIGPRTYLVSGVATAVDINVLLATFDVTFYLHHGSAHLDDTTYSADGVGIGTAGVILSDAGAPDDYTFADFQAAVNASTNWRCTLLGALPTDNFYTHVGTLQTCVDIADGTNSTNSDNEIGAVFYFTNDILDFAAACVGLEAAGSGFGPFLSRHSASSAVLRARRDVDNLGDGEVQVLDRVNFITRIAATATFAGGGNATLTIYAVDSSGNVRTVYTESGAATTVEHAFAPEAAIVSLPGERLVAQYAGGTLTVGAIEINGGWGVLRV